VVAVLVEQPMAGLFWEIIALLVGETSTASVAGKGVGVGVVVALPPPHAVSSALSATKNPTARNEPRLSTTFLLA
jgi:hypothetical protein